ncbi:MAG: FG-GAP-like repeat-containing protein [Pirellulaceae bacterium]
MLGSRRSSRWWLSPVELLLLSLFVVAAAMGCSSGDRAAPDRDEQGSEAVSSGVTPQALTPEQVAELNRGVALLGRYQYAAAGEVFAALAEQVPWFIPAQLNLAIAQLNEDQSGTRAESVLRKILASQPDNAAAQYCLGLVLLHGNRDDEALPHLQAAYDADPHDPYTTFLLARSLESTSREEALTWYEKTVLLDPMFKTAHYRLRELYRLSGEAEKAGQALERFQELAKCPTARTFDYKYTLMGSKATAHTLQGRSARTLPTGGSLFQPAQPLAKDSEPLLPVGPTSITVCDIDGDGRLDLFLSGVRTTDDGPANAILWQQSDGTFRADTAHRLAGVTHVTAVVWGDFNEDKRNDVYLCRAGSNEMWWQVEEGRWEDVTQTTNTGAGDRATVDAVAFDADHDADLDLFVVQLEGPNVLLNNNRNGTFEDIAERSGLAAIAGPSRAVLPVDLDHDLDLDLIVIQAEPPHEIFRNDLSWKYERIEAVESFRQSSIVAAVAGDTNADGRPEIFSLGDQGLQRWLPEDWTQWPWEVINEQCKPTSSRTQLALCDADGDGSFELIVGGESWQLLPLTAGAANPMASSGEYCLTAWTAAVLDGRRGPSILGVPRDQDPVIWPPGQRRHDFLALTLSGRTSTEMRYRTNSSGVGARTEVRVGTQTTVIDPLSANSGPGQSLQPVAAGLGGWERADFVRIEWPDGVAQVEMDLQSGWHKVDERDDMPSSCPLLFAWDGTRFGFVSDLLSGGGLGYLVAPGSYASPDPIENFLMPEGSLAEHDGRFLLKLTEPMAELTYLDRAGLVAYDLPPGWHMTLDARLAVEGPRPTGEPRFYRQLCLPARATNERGEDVTESVLEVDDQAAPVGELDDRFWGKLAREHTLVLEFDRPLASGPGTPVLVADGWVEFPFSQTAFAAWQAAERFCAPTLEVQGADGQWQLLLAEFGYPGGMPRQMSVPLDKDRLPPRATALRIRTNQEIYWDRLAVVWVEPCPDAVRHELPLARAELRESGFTPRIVGPQQRPMFDYDRRMPSAPVCAPAGFYTAFGPVEELVTAADNALAIFGPGEEIHLEFMAPPSGLPAGTRRLVFESRGWCKDMDLYTQHGGMVEPLPQAGPLTTDRDRLHQRLNTRYEEGR